jgi:hypothetical protein
MNRIFFVLLETWSLAGICLVMLVRRHRLRLEAGFVW